MLHETMGSLVADETEDRLVVGRRIRRDGRQGKSEGEERAR
jgi:hypothetical protein